MINQLENTVNTVKKYAILTTCEVGGGVDRRVNWIDTVKGLAVLLVIFNHVSSGTFVNDFISSFHVPVFFFVTGYLLHEKGSYDFNKYNRILVPYFYFSVIAIIINCAWNFIILGDATAQLVSYVYRFISGYGILAIWFLSSYFIARLTFSFIGKYPTAVRCTFLFVILIFSYIIEYTVAENAFGITLLNDGEILYYFSIAIFRGLACTIYIEIGFDLAYLINKLISTKRIYCLLISIFLFVLDALFIMLNDDVNFSLLHLGTPPYIYVCGIIGSVAFLLLTYSLFKNSNITILTFLSKNSIIVMCTHMTLYFTTISAIAVSFISNAEIQSFLIRAALWITRSIAATIIVVSLEIITVMIINRYFPFLLGMRSLKKSN